jgi:serine protease Do
MFASPYANADIRSSSGFIVHPDGYIVTNQHVIKDASEIIVSTHTGRKLLAEVIATDDMRDIALLRVEASGLPYVALGDSNLIRILDTIVALGFPLAQVIGTEVSGVSA